MAYQAGEVFLANCCDYAVVFLITGDILFPFAIWLSEVINYLKLRFIDLYTFLNIFQFEKFLLRTELKPGLFGL